MAGKTARIGAQRAEHISLEHRPYLGVGHQLYRAEIAEAGVVDEHIDAAGSCERAHRSRWRTDASSVTSSRETVQLESLGLRGVE